jgi:hypothetical protein
MSSGTAEPECPQRQRIILPATLSAAEATPTPAALPPAADDAPHRDAPKIVAHATIYLVVDGAARAGRQPFVTATQTSGGAYRATGRAIAVG